MTDISPTPMAPVGGATLVLTGASTDLTAPVSGTITLQYHGNPSALLTVTIDGAEVAVVFSYGAFLTQTQFSILVPTISVTYTTIVQLDMTVDTKQLTNGLHFLYVTGYDLNTNLPIVQLRNEFTVNNAMPVTYSGTTALVNPPLAGTYPHFASDGSVIQTYMPGKSIFPVMYFSFNGAEPSAAQMASTGLTAYFSGTFTNPNDGGNDWRALGVDTPSQYAVWQANERSFIDSTLTAYKSFFLWLAFDDCLRNVPEREFTANCPWAQTAFGYAFTYLLSQGYKTVIISGIDEVNGVLGATATPSSTPPAYTSDSSGTYLGHAWLLPNNIITQIYNTIKAADGAVNVSWPPAAYLPADMAVSVGSWCGVGVADFAILYATTLSWANPYAASGLSLYDLSYWSSSEWTACFATMQRQKPWSGICVVTAAAGVQVTPQMAVGSICFAALIMGAPALQLTWWSPLITGFAANITAIAPTLMWFQANLADLFQPLGAAPNLGPWLATSLRSGNSSRVLTVLNLADVDLAISVDTGTFLGGGESLLRYTFDSTGVGSSTQTSGMDTFTILANQTVVYIAPKAIITSDVSVVTRIQSDQSSVTRIISDQATITRIYSDSQRIKS